MHILIAPNAFKNSLPADAAAAAISKGLDESQLSCTCTCFPVADGGDGTAALLIKHLHGKIIDATVNDPQRRRINTSFGLIENDETAVIELADASGLRLLQPGEYDPLHATTYGTGELIKFALDKGVKKIIMGIGGSATVDAGTGIMQALGIKFLDKKKDELRNLPASLTELEDIDITGLDKRIANTELIILCDVENFLLGAQGAASVFGPQKGASTGDVQKLEACLTNIRDIVSQKTSKDMAAVKYGGASGGVAAGLHALLNAKLVNGIEYFLEITGFEHLLQNADLVITGEGSIDTQTLQGKGPFGVAKRAKEKSIPVIGMAGRVPLIHDRQLQEYFNVLLPINNEATGLKEAMENTEMNLIRTAVLLGNMLSM